jgi:plastocyanin
MKKLAVFLLIAVTVVAAGCTDSTESTSTPETESPDNTQPTDLEQENNTIFYTDSGFQPADLTVQQGDTVTWLDRSSNTMWVGSDRHPSHTNYAGTTRREHCQDGDQTTAAFDQCTTGDRFSFTFEKTGEWGYHNHQPFERGGTVTVE